MRRAGAALAALLWLAAAAGTAQADDDLPPVGQPTSYRLELLSLAGAFVPTDPLGGGLGVMVTGGVRFSESWSVYLRPTFTFLWGDTPESRIRMLLPLLLEGRVHWRYHFALGPSLDFGLKPSTLVRPGFRARVGMCVLSIGTTGCAPRPGTVPNDNADVSIDLEAHTTIWELDPATVVEVTLLLGASFRFNY